MTSPEPVMRELPVIDTSASAFAVTVASRPPAVFAGSWTARSMIVCAVVASGMRPLAIRRDSIDVSASAVIEIALPVTVAPRSVTDAC
ncbi:MAG: hypothetical protein MUF30_10625, partial [Burkholderiales bacterium]|nr:hypothetical protein [Burkholderiales bacterium]